MIPCLAAVWIYDWRAVTDHVRYIKITDVNKISNAVRTKYAEWNIIAFSREAFVVSIRKSGDGSPIDRGRRNQSCWGRIKRRMYRAVNRGTVPLIGSAAAQSNVLPFVIASYFNSNTSLNCNLNAANKKPARPGGS